VFNKYAGILFSALAGMEAVPEPVLPYPHARNDCGICHERDADFQIVEEAMDPPDWTGREARRFCQGRIGRWMTTRGDVPAGRRLIRGAAGRDAHPAAPGRGIVVTSAALPDGPLLEGSLGNNPLAAEPAASTGALIGYARVSTGGQRLDRQMHALTEAGCIRIFADKKSGKNIDREELWKALGYLRPGDTLVVPRWTGSAARCRT
jgi:resolvase-like protein